AIPDVYAGYAALHAGAMGDGALPAKVKELIALAIAVTRECDGCVTAHARAAVRQGVTAAEVAEAMGVAILMNGGAWASRGPPALRRVRGVRGVPRAPPRARQAWRVRRVRRGQPTRVLTEAIRSVSADLASANNMLVFGFTYSSLSIPA